MTKGRVLIIAGSDSGGGAGIQADIKTVTMLGGYAMTAITAITVQNTLGVSGVHVVPTETVVAQIRAVVDDLGVDAIKIGMLGDAELVEAVADAVRACKVPVVLDPVMIAKGGAALLQPEAVDALMRHLLPLATVVTPNLPELEVLTDTKLEGSEAMRLAAHRLLEHGSGAVLAKGGHLLGDEVVDWLVMENGVEYSYTDQRLNTVHTHGTGCTLSSAVTAGLAQGLPLPRAVKQARQFVQIALREAPILGQGHGPMGHAKVRMDLQGINHLILPIENYAASVNFYQMLGLRQIVDYGDSYARFEDRGGVTISLSESARASGIRIYIECENVDARILELKEKGIRIDHEPEDRKSGWREAWISDPAGNQICLYNAGVERRFPRLRL